MHLLPVFTVDENSIWDSYITNIVVLYEIYIYLFLIYMYVYSNRFNKK